MSFEQKTWTDRDVQYPGKRTITNVNDSSDIQDVYVTRAEGTISTQGDLWCAETMNNMEERIANAFSEIIQSLETTYENVYPVGAIYQSFSSTSPETLFPGTSWVQISGRVLLPVSASSSSLVTGGSNTRTITPTGSVSLWGTVAGHVLTESEMPAHTHTLSVMKWSGSSNIGYNSSGYFNGKDVTVTTTTTGSNNAHSHGFSVSGSFSPNSITLDIRQPYMTMYAWRRTA